jgi:beta-glucosidase
MGLPFVSRTVPDTRIVCASMEVERISLLPGEQKTVRFVLHPDDLALLDRNMNWTVEPGQFELMAGSSSVDIKLKKIVQIK